MADHFTYLSPIIPNLEIQKLVTAIILGMVITLVAKRATTRLSTAGAIAAAIIPDSRISLFGFLDFFVEAFVKFHDSLLGANNRRHVPFNGTIFIFILSANLIGLVPGVPAATTTVWVNVGLSTLVFVYFNYWGIRTNGLFNYLKHMASPLMLAPFLFPLELFGLCLRVLTLNLRLYWNITADHLVLTIFTDMLGPLFPAALYVLGTFVCFMQAFIFTTLSMVYILLAIGPHDEEH
ncbi:MAG: F0F1 ATP synthase subunit A [Oligoflexia bacterium]|nr:F0F1 ATP synthase subunit A [Oligoflexia bacterium]